MERVSMIDFRRVTDSNKAKNLVTYLRRHLGGEKELKVFYVMDNGNLKKHKKHVYTFKLEDCYLALRSGTFYQPRKDILDATKKLSIEDKVILEGSKLAYRHKRREAFIARWNRLFKGDKNVED